jgi:hypothetical protein
MRAVGRRLHLLPRTRDFTAIHDMLIDRGLAVSAGNPLTPPSGEIPDDLPEVVAKVRALADQVR